MLDRQISHIIGLSLMCCGQKLITKTRKGSKCLCIIVQLQLKLNIRSLIAACHENSKDLLDLCIDVIYHDKMKAYGLRNLVNLYGEWAANHPQENTEERSTEAQD